MHRIRMPLYAPVTAYTNILNFLSRHNASASGSASSDLILQPLESAASLLNEFRATPTPYSPLLDPQPIIPRRRPKEQQHHHLQHNPRNNTPVPMLHHLQVLLGSARGQRAADGLHQEARHVERDEDERVQARADAGQGRVEGQADVLEGEVDGDAHEGRREDDGDDLGLERVLVPGVVGEGDARGVAWLFGRG